MLKKYPETITQSEELKIGPTAATLKTLLNYSKSVEVKKVKKKNLMVHLN
jgi:hypothetical protein